MNMNWQERDTIIFGSPKNWGDKHFSGIESFDGMNVETLKTLIEKGFVNPEECQNSSPSIRDFVEFMEKNPEFVVSGYVVSPNRNDYRTSVERIHFEGYVSKQMIIDFIKFSNGADELDVEENHLSAWWD
jgi:hypothetical protein